MPESSAALFSPGVKRNSMSRETRAVIDVGTNSVKLLVATVHEGVIHPIIEDSKQTRLGKGFFQTRHLQPEAIAETAEAVQAFAATAREWDVSRLGMIATSAARDAINASELVQALEAAANAKLAIISGEQEADWAFKGVCTDPAMHNQNLLVLDLGGGSTEFILGRNGSPAFARSFRLGTVRLLESLSISDPPTPEQKSFCTERLVHFLSSEVEPWIAPIRAQFQNLQLIATGGTPAILARMQLGLRRYDRELIEQTAIPLSDLSELNSRLWNLSLEQRKLIPGLPGNRADVILTGASIFEQIMFRLELNTLRVSTRGLRFAALLH
jgi:exopolyphosphatase/guanosine-5'-triphosphate,3'-diphosphate pyrophosphatase